MINELSRNPVFFLRYSPPEPSRTSDAPHSHSIINESAKQLVLFGCSRRRKLHTVIFTVARQLKAEHSIEYATATKTPLEFPNLEERFRERDAER
jgi:hypothetical protein